MRQQTRLYWPLLALTALLLGGCASVQTTAKTETIVIYDGHTIGPNIGISTGLYTQVDGYRFVNIAVEYEQTDAAQEPVSLGVIFAHDPAGKWGSRRYFNFEQNFAPPADPQMITLSGESSWHGHPHDKSSYTARLPIMGPYIQVFPFNHHDQARTLSVVLYLSG